MKVNITEYSNKVIDGFSKEKNDTLTLNQKKRMEFNQVLSDVEALVDEHTIFEYDVNVLDGGALVAVEIEIGYFNEDIATSQFVRLCERCVRFEIHPAKLTKIVFIFDGLWDCHE